MRDGCINQAKFPFFQCNLSSIDDLSKFTIIDVTDFYEVMDMLRDRGETIVPSNGKILILWDIPIEDI